jgi:hypothetical protein
MSLLEEDNDDELLLGVGAVDSTDGKEAWGGHEGKEEGGHQEGEEEEDVEHVQYTVHGALRACSNSRVAAFLAVSLGVLLLVLTHELLEGPQIELIISIQAGLDPEGAAWKAMVFVHWLTGLALIVAIAVVVYFLVDHRAGYELLWNWMLSAIWGETLAMLLGCVCVYIYIYMCVCMCTFLHKSYSQCMTLFGWSFSSTYSLPICQVSPALLAGVRCAGRGLYGQLQHA